MFSQKMNRSRFAPLVPLAALIVAFGFGAQASFAQSRPDLGDEIAAKAQNARFVASPMVMVVSLALAAPAGKLDSAHAFPPSGNPTITVNGSGWTPGAIVRVIFVWRGRQDILTNATPDGHITVSQSFHGLPTGAIVHISATSDGGSYSNYLTVTAP